VNVLDILSRCQTLGITLTPGDAGKLRVSPRGMLSDELREQLQRVKPTVACGNTSCPCGNRHSSRSCAPCSCSKGVIREAGP
jgi:hypothetical protein